MASTERSEEPAVRTVRTAAGDADCAVVGEGPPVLVVHGSPGGHDAGLAMARFLVADGLRAVVPDRPGYFGPAQVGEPGPGSSSRGARGHDVVIDEDQVVDAEALELLGRGGSGAAGADDSDGEGSQ